MAAGERLWGNGMREKSCSLPPPTLLQAEWGSGWRRRVKVPGLHGPAGITASTLLPLSPTLLCRIGYNTSLSLFPNQPQTVG